MGPQRPEPSEKSSRPRTPGDDGIRIAKSDALKLHNTHARLVPYRAPAHATAKTPTIRAALQPRRATRVWVRNAARRASDVAVVAAP